MKVVILGEERQRPHIKKVRLTLTSTAGQVMDELEVMLDTIFPFSISDNLFTQLSRIEIDVWVDTETGNITVDGAW
jgi:hypothetical protein